MLAPIQLRSIGGFLRRIFPPLLAGSRASLRFPDSILDTVVPVIPAHPSSFEGEIVLLQLASSTGAQNFLGPAGIMEAPDLRQGDMLIPVFVNGQLTTSAVVGNRGVRLELNLSNGVPLWRFPSPNVQIAGSVRTYQFTAFGTQQQIINGGETYEQIFMPPIPFMYHGPPGFEKKQLVLNTTNLDGADTWAALFAICWRRAFD